MNTSKQRHSAVYKWPIFKDIVYSINSAGRNGQEIWREKKIQFSCLTLHYLKINSR